MKKYSLVLLLCIIQSQSFGQEESDLYVSYQHEFGLLNSDKTQSFQLQAKYFVADEISFNYYIGARQFKNLIDLNF